MRTMFSVDSKPSQVMRFALRRIFIILTVLFLYSCEKSFDVNSTSNERIRSRVPGVTVSQGMLKFDDTDAVIDYLELVQEYRDEHLSDNDNSMLLADVDPGVYELEDELGFKCLSSLYDELEYDDYEFRSNARSNLDIYLGDPDLQLILNQAHEVWIEDTIYKVIANYKYYKIVGADLGVLQSIRADPEEPTVDTNTILSYFNDNVLPIKFRSVCSVFLEFVKKPPTSGLSPRVYVNLKMIDQDGNISNCSAGDVTIDWGDGSSPTVTDDGIISHAYSVSPNSTETFTIQASLDLVISSFCLECDEGIYTAPNVTYTVTNNLCRSDMTDEQLLLATYFVANGKEWKVQGFGGQQPKYVFLSDRKVWGEIFLYQKNNNGNYKRKRPDISSFISVEGESYSEEDCLEDEDAYSVNEQKRDSRLCVRELPYRGNFASHDELSVEPIIDYRVFITSSVLANFSDLDNELFSD